MPTPPPDDLAAVLYLCDRVDAFLESPLVGRVAAGPTGDENNQRNYP